MSKLIWPTSPSTVVQRYEQRNNRPEFGRLVMWSVWAVESLHYLSDLDESQAEYPVSPHGFPPDIVDIAHVRWATATAITSLDLCAAALGRVYCGHDGPRELDLRDFDTARQKAKRARERRKKLPDLGDAWIGNLLSDTRYLKIHAARNPMTHSWLNRLLSRGGEGGHAQRTQFRIKDFQTDNPLGARTFITLAKDLATQQVSEFLNVVDAL